MESSTAGRRPEALIALAAAVALIALTAWLGRLELLDPDEGRHAEIAREMLVSGHWLTPVLHGKPYDDKPAAFYWLLAASMRWLGENAFAARVPVSLASLWTILVSARFAQRAYGGNAGALSAIGLGTTIGFVALGRTVLIDACFTAALTSAFVWLGHWHLDEPARRRPIWPFYVALAGACLLKGPAAIVLAGMLAAGLTLADRDASYGRALRPVQGLGIVLAIALPWYLAAWLAEPSYIEAFLLRHNISRYLHPISRAHDEPWYYYLLALPAALLPWTPLLAKALAERLAAARRTRADVFLGLWAGCVLLFFLPAKTKLLTYLLPAFPPLVALGAAWANDANAREKAEAWLVTYARAWCTLAAVAALATACVFIRHMGRAWTDTVLVLLVLLPLAAALKSAPAQRAWTPAAALAGATLAVILLAFGWFSTVLNELRGARAAGLLVAAATTEEAPFVAYRCTPNAVAFYARRLASHAADAFEARTRLVDGGEPLMMERKRMGELGLDPPPAGVTLAWQNVNGLVLLLPKPALPEMAEKGGSRTLRQP